MDYEAVIRRYIAENILFSGNQYPYPDDVSFLDNGIIDSVNVMQLVMFAEEKFQIAVEDAEIVPDNFDSVKQLGAYVRRKTLVAA